MCELPYFMIYDLFPMLINHATRGKGINPVLIKHSDKLFIGVACRDHTKRRSTILPKNTVYSGLPQNHPSAELLSHLPGKVHGNSLVVFF